MYIECGKYTLKTDQYKNMWIDEKYMGETKDGVPKESIRRVSGYMTNISNLTQDFLEKRLYGSDETEIVGVLEQLKQAQEDINLIAKQYMEVKKSGKV